jgi:hypothetical protein
MIATILACVVQTAPLIADQSWKFDAGMIGNIDFKDPLGVIENPIVAGIMAFTNDKSTKAGFDLFTLSMKVKKNQSPLIEAFSSAIADSNIGPKNDKDFVYVTYQYWLRESDLVVGFDESGSYVQPTQILNPFAVGVAVIRRTMTNPELRKEFYLMADGPRKFYAKFSPNLNATADPGKGELALRFNVILREGDKTFPKFFTGVVRANTKSRKVEYIKAGSYPDDGPLEVGESAFPDVKSFAINLIAK